MSVSKWTFPLFSLLQYECHPVLYPLKLLYFKEIGQVVHSQPMLHCLSLCLQNEYLHQLKKHNIYIKLNTNNNTKSENNTLWKEQRQRISVWS